MEQIITIDRLSRYLSVNKRTLYRLVQNGEIPGFKIGGAWRFDTADIKHWIEKQKSITVSSMGNEMKDWKI